MARRMGEPADGLDYPGKRQVRRSTRRGGRDATAVGERYQRKTYVLERDQVDRIKVLAQGQGIGINALTRWLLTHALDAIESGEWELPIEEVTVKRLVSD